MTIMHSPLLLAVPPQLMPIGLTVLVGMAAVYLLMPRPKPYPGLWGGAAGGIALLLTGAQLIHTGLSPEAVLFYAFSGIAIIAGVLLITQSNPARAALSFALVVLSTCGLFLLQGAPFLMAATTIIYAGAIIVTFLFVLMLAQQHGQSDADLRSREPFLATLAGFVLLGALIYVLQLTYTTPKLDELLARVHKAAEQKKSEDIVKELGNDEDNKFFKDLGEAIRTVRGGRELQDIRLNKVDYDLAVKWTAAARLPEPERTQEMKKVLEEIAELGQRCRVLAGRLAPPLTPDRPLSDLSGPPPNRTIRFDARGNAPLPADNTAFLGRALFTDYLLAVELGGTLLLVATVGAIAIAGRREGRRS